MTNENQSADGQILPEENQTESETRQRKDKKNQTDNVKWSIFTEAETKAGAVKAAKKAGLKLNEWIDRTLRDAATTELTKKAQPPAKPEDMVKDIVAQMAERLKADQAATAEAQSALIREQGDQIAKLTQVITDRPATIKEMLFGKTKPKAAE